MYRLICHQYMRSGGIRIRINRNRSNAESFGCAHHPAGNLPTVGNQKFGKQRLCHRYLLFFTQLGMAL